MASALRVVVPEFGHKESLTNRKIFFPEWRVSPPEGDVQLRLSEAHYRPYRSGACDEGALGGGGTIPDLAFCRSAFQFSEDAAKGIEFLLR